MHRQKALDQTFPTTPHMIWGTCLTLKTALQVTGPICYVSLESPLKDLSNDTSHDGAMRLTFISPLTVDSAISCSVGRRTDGRTRHSHKGITPLNIEHGLKNHQNFSRSNETTLENENDRKN
jgi:hypothetical protein